MLLHNDRMRESRTTLKLVSYTTVLLHWQINVYENLLPPRSLVPCRSEVHNRLYYTTTAQRPCCCTIQHWSVYKHLVMRCLSKTCTTILGIILLCHSEVQQRLYDAIAVRIANHVVAVH